VRTASVNPIDWKLASGAYRWLLPVRFPAVPGFDVCGDVEAVHPSVSGLKPGQRVHARLLGRHGGACATHAVVDASVAAVVTASISDEAAAGLPLAGLTALQALRDEGRLPIGPGEASGRRVLVIGAAGGVGHLAVQVAAAAGAHVVALCSPANTALVASWGAHEVVDRHDSEAVQRIDACDVVLDAATSDWRRWIGKVVRGGTYVTCLPAPGALLRGALNRLSGQRVRAVMMRSDGDDLRTLDQLFIDGRLKVHIAGVLPMAQLAEAWRGSISGRTVGKWIVQAPRDD